MGGRTCAAEQIINKLREVEVLLSQGDTVGEASRKIGVTEQTYYRWRREYGGMRVEQARRLKEMERVSAAGPGGCPASPRRCRSNYSSGTMIGG